MGKLTSLEIERLEKKGRYADGDGLYLQVATGGSKSWIFRYTINGKTKEMGLGSYLPPMRKANKTERELPLTIARDEARKWRELLKQGQDPLKIKQEEQQRKRLEEVKNIPFKECALKYIETHEESWRNAKHRLQWKNTLESYVYGKGSRLTA